MASKLSPCHIRIARPTRDMGAVVRFYGEGVGLEVLGSFLGHAGYDGTMMGWPGAAWHLEFTFEHDRPFHAAPTEEDLLVFYLPDSQEYKARIAALTHIGATPVPSANPYWDEAGTTFEDPDGYRVVIAQREWGA